MGLQILGLLTSLEGLEKILQQVSSTKETSFSTGADGYGGKGTNDFIRENKIEAAKLAGKYGFAVTEGDWIEDHFGSKINFGKYFLFSKCPRKE